MTDDELSNWLKHVGKEINNIITVKDYWKQYIRYIE